MTNDVLCDDCNATGAIIRCDIQRPVEAADLFDTQASWLCEECYDKELVKLREATA